MTELGARNKASWQAVIQTIKSRPEDGRWPKWKSTLLDMIDACVERGLDEYFRAGTAMHDVIFSTAYDGLEKATPPPPRVTVHWDGQFQLMISWSHTNPSLYGAERQHEVIGDAFPILRPYLADLWRETQPMEELPPGLREGLPGEC